MPRTNYNAGFIPSKQGEQELKIDMMEKRIREKIDISAGFSEPEVKSRKLANCFKYFDVSGNGIIGYREFFAAMTKLNFVGCQREIEALFNRYDEVLLIIIYFLVSTSYNSYSRLLHNFLERVWIN